MAGQGDAGLGALRADAETGAPAVDKEDDDLGQAGDDASRVTEDERGSPDQEDEKGQGGTGADGDDQQTWTMDDKRYKLVIPYPKTAGRALHWDYFKRLDDLETGAVGQYAKCNFCDKVLKAKGNKAMVNHCRTMHEEEYDRLEAEREQSKATHSLFSYGVTSTKHNQSLILGQRDFEVSPVPKSQSRLCLKLLQELMALWIQGADLPESLPDHPLTKMIFNLAAPHLKGQC